MNSVPAECDECGAFLGNPKNFTHLITEGDTIKLGLNCGSCNAMNEVHVKVHKVEKI